MTLSELTARWQARRAEYEGVGALVDGVKVMDVMLRELAELHQSMSADAVTLKEASLIGGYSVDHLQRLVASGQLENVGRKGRPRIRRADVPTRPGHRLPTTTETDQLSARRRIVASVTTKSVEAS